ncbi:nucleoside ABC transporter membrane protein [Peptoclostridium litorale DSM 5388]|uniref:Putative glucose ABC transporter permease protein n=1 Tax=Peptoclostridium litorale DSM 5388 TaxID=1121324 RepID=A0A069RE56_PEPLI|nr:ABC transporter permease [Peptoclostridium litorale]KDR93932.1 putative glucose ABC transporter permease protein TsgC13 [Peptoclostridium litorale DSM 5388]KDR95359.1 putative glucose ABC transporter permease protein [Peptoclostridium litorale DSM 5388]SIN88842.1 nucleoside ABC transporter membrane protein [Peptoclostridium litorale DSM 5388]
MALVAFLSAAIQAGTPLLFATLGEIVTEKSGNLNLGVEGMMLIGAVAGFKVGLITSSPLLAIIGAVIAGALSALIFAFLTVTLRANQVVSGLSLTILGTGISSFIGQSLIGTVVPQKVGEFFKAINLPLLSQIPFMGDVIFKQNVFVYMGYVCAIAIGVYMYRTRKGLNLRMVGENPAAADASGINVTLYKYVHILAGGALCALGGAYLSLVYVPAWQENVTAGRGWIAVALVIFSMWNPYKAMASAYFFGGLDIIGFRIQKYNLPISQYVIDMLPYIATILVLVVVSAKKSKENMAPESLGVSYFREDR